MRSEGRKEGRGGAGVMDSPAPPEKVVVLLKATGDAPILKQSKFKVLKTERFLFVSSFLQKNLKLDNVVSSTPASPLALPRASASLCTHVPRPSPHLSRGAVGCPPWLSWLVQHHSSHH